MRAIERMWWLRIHGFFAFSNGLLAAISLDPVNAVIALLCLGCFINAWRSGD